MGGSQDRRRTDSRERIRSLALQLFTEQGYGATSLNQIAERLGMTRAAVLHHFSSKEALLTSSFDDLLPELDRLLGRLASDPSRAARVWAVERFASMVCGDDGLVLACAQVNQGALGEIPAAQDLHHRLEMFTQAIAGDDGVEGRMRARLAVGALVMAEARGAELGGRLDERRDAALNLARQLIP